MKIDGAMIQVVCHRPVISEIVFDRRLGNLGFVAEEVALGKVFPRLLRSCPAFVLP
jgi:hypothetical protein